jgi:tetratricopeptide (TPR) repeat protein/O-antigen ligase
VDNLLSQVIKVGLVLILIVVPLIYSPYLQDSFSTPKKAFFQISIAVLLCVFAIQIAIRPERLASHSTPLDKILLIWLAWNAVATLVSIDRPGSTQELIYTSCIVALFFLVTRSVTTYRQAWFLVGVIIAMAVLESSYGIAERFGTKYLYEKDIIDSSFQTTEKAWRGNILGTFGNANHLATYLVLSTPLVLGYIILSGSRYWFIFLPCLITVLGCLVLTAARAAWMAVFVSLSLLILFGFRQSKRIGLSLTGFVSLMLIGVILLILFTQPNILTELTGRIKQSFSVSSGSLGYRFLAWRLSLSMIATRPFLGSGPGTFKILFLPTLADFLKGGNPLSYWHINEKMNEPHNEYLQTAVETGIPGLLILLTIFSTALYTGWENLKKVPPSTGFLISALLASLIAVLAHAFASIPFHVVPTLIAFWVIMSVFFSLLTMNAPVPQRAPSGRRVWRWVLVVTLAAFACVTVRETLREIEFSLYFKSATTRNRLNKFEDALPYFQRALEIYPQSGRLKFYYGSTLVHLGRYAEGVKLLEESKKNFQDIYIYKNLGLAYCAMGKIEKAIEQYSRWREMGIASHEANNQIAFIRLSQRRISDAEELFKETLRARPWDWTAHSTLGIIQMDSGRLDEAVQTLQPDVFWAIPDAYSLYGVALLKAGRYDEAAKNFLIALTKNPDSVRARNNLAALYYKTGEIDEAIREWKKVLETDPENEIAKRNLKTAQQRITPIPGETE